MTTAAPAAAASHVEVSLCSLSSDLLMHVSHWLDIKELCVFDIATAINKQLRAKYLSGLRNDSFLYSGADVDKKSSAWQDKKSSAWQEEYAQWLTMRHVFVNSISLNEKTSASVLFAYCSMNRVSPGLVSLKIDGKVDFPKDLAVRNAKTLRKLTLRNIGKFGSEQLRKFTSSVREWGSMGGSMEDLRLWNCNFGDEAVDFGNCDSLTELTIWDCSSNISTTPGDDSQGCTRLLWGILPKCVKLVEFDCRYSDAGSVSLSDRDLCLLARFCPHLTRLWINLLEDEFSEAALMRVAMKFTKLKCLYLSVPTAFTDRTIEAIAANLVSLRKLRITNLKLHKSCTLRCLAVGCPELRELCIKKGNGHVTEAELLYLVKHAKNLQGLKIGKWEHLDFKASWAGLEPYTYAPEDLLELGVEDPEALIASQRDRLQSIRAATEQPDAMDTVDKLLAASSNPEFEVQMYE
jgi:hypothetical protein